MKKVCRQNSNTKFVFVAIATTTIKIEFKKKKTLNVNHNIRTHRICSRPLTDVHNRDEYSDRDDDAGGVGDGDHYHILKNMVL